MKGFEAYPSITHGEGRKLYSADDWWWDGTSSMWLTVHGHRVPELDAAVREQLDRVAHSTLLGMSSEPSIRYAKRLAKHTPGLPWVFYSDDGSTAVEAGLKMALQYWAQTGRPDKQRVASFDGAYHGDTFGAIGAAPVPFFHDAYREALPRAPIRLPWPDTTRGPHAGDPDATRTWALEEADRALATFSELAVVIVEPVQFVGGMRIMPPGYLKGLRQLCTERDVLLMLDEVATGFGRTGKMFAHHHDGLEPDLMALGKGMSGGYMPLAATLASDQVFDAFLGEPDEMKTFYHGHSYTGNALACAVADASLLLLERMLDKLPAKAAQFSREVSPLADHPCVAEVRTHGFLAGFDLVVDKPAKTPFPWQSRAGWCIYEEALNRHLIARPYASTGMLVPPVGSLPEELSEMANIYTEALEAARPRLRRLGSAGRNIPEVPQ